jgi:hypothetical protein
MNIYVSDISSPTMTAFDTDLGGFIDGRDFNRDKFNAVFLQLVGNLNEPSPRAAFDSLSQTDGRNQ